MKTVSINLAANTTSAAIQDRADWFYLQSLTGVADLVMTLDGEAPVKVVAGQTWEVPFRSTLYLANVDAVNAATGTLVYGEGPVPQFLAPSVDVSVINTPAVDVTTLPLIKVASGEVIGVTPYVPFAPTHGRLLTAGTIQQITALTVPYEINVWASVPAGGSPGAFEGLIGYISTMTTNFVSVTPGVQIKWIDNQPIWGKITSTAAILNYIVRQL